MSGARAPPCYQIDFNAIAAGKRVAATKRRVRWRFGFPNPQALEQGRSGSECRGEEHEITIVWSVTSGKRQILMNGKEVHYSSTRAGILDHSWNVKGNHVLKVVCHASPPLSANPGFRQYDLFIDGQSFFSMPRIHEIGVKGATPGRAPGPPYNNNNQQQHMGGGSAQAYSSPRTRAPPTGAAIAAPRSAVEEEEDLQRAISASLEESRRHLGEKKPGGGGGGPPKPHPDLTSTPAPGSDLLGFSSGGGGAGTANVLDFNDNQTTISYTSAPTYIAPTTTTAAPPLATTNNNQTMVLAPTQPASQFGMAQPPPPLQQQAYAQQLQPPPPSVVPQQQPYGQQPQMYPQPTTNDFHNFAATSALPPQQQQTFSPPPTTTNNNDGVLLYETTAATAASYGSPASDQLVAGGHSFDDPFAPKPPSRDEINSNILNAYGGGTTPATPGGAAAGVGGYATPTHPALSMDNNNNNNAHNETGLAVTTLEEEPEPSNPLDAAMKKLVNFDHIDEPAEEKVKLTMKEHEDEEVEKNKNKSKPLPPAGHRMMGSHATLNQISTVKSHKTGNENVMKAPPQLFSPDAAMAGALVVHGAPNQGPPPLPPRGVGQVHGQAYTPQQFVQQQQPMQGYGQQQLPPPMAPGYGQQQPMMQGGQPGYHYPMQQPQPHHHQPQGYATTQPYGYR